MLLPLLQTKLYAPPLRQPRVSRPAVMTKLDRGALHPLTLIAAPAGFGKTTLVSEWSAQGEQPVAWLSLDDDDNDPVRFLTYLVAALRTVYNQVGESSLVSLHAPQPPPAKVLLTQLINDLSRAAAVILVLDDYHLLTTPSIHEALIFLIEHLPPALHLMIISRIDPPSPWPRARPGRMFDVSYLSSKREHSRNARTISPAGSPATIDIMLQPGYNTSIVCNILAISKDEYV